MKPFEVGGAVAALALLAPTSASAGAWLSEDGEDIFTQSFGRTEQEQFYETSLYWEAGLGERVAVVAAPWMRQGAQTGDAGWRGEVVVGFKAELAHSDRVAVAVQAGVLWRSEDRVGCGEGGAELRWLGGLSLGDEGRGFVNLEAAARLQGGGCSGERFDVSVGYRPNEHWLGMAQIFIDDARYDEQAVNAQLSLVRFGDDGRGLQLGLRARIDGEEAEPALVLGVWGRPQR